MFGQWVHFVAGLVFLNICYKCWSPFVLGSWDCCNKSPALFLKITEIHFLTTPEARSTKSRCQQGHISFQDSREGLFPSSMSGDCWWSVVSLAGGSISPVSVSIFIWTFFCLSPCDFCSDSYNGYSTLDLQPTLIQDDLISRSLP